MLITKSYINNSKMIGTRVNISYSLTFAIANTTTTHCYNMGKYKCTCVTSQYKLFLARDRQILGDDDDSDKVPMKPITLVLKLSLLF